MITLNDSDALWLRLIIQYAMATSGSELFVKDGSTYSYIIDLLTDGSETELNESL